MFLYVFDQNRKTVEAQNQRTCTPADFIALRLVCQKHPPEVFYKKAVLEYLEISTGKTCVGVSF